MEKTTTRAIVGLAIDSDPIRYRGRLVMNDGERIGRTLSRACPSVFKSITDLVGFIMQYHWLGLTRCDLRQDPLPLETYTKDRKSGVNRPPVHMGGRVGVVGVGDSIEWFTEESPTWFVEYIHLVYMPSFKLVTYKRSGDDFQELEAIDLEFEDRSLPWLSDEKIENPDQ